MTHEQIEKLLELLDSIDTSLAVMADYSEKIALLFEKALETDDEGIKTIRVVDVDARHER
jgi:hypothetical protein